MVSLELAGETLDRFRSFVGRGYPQVPHRVPPTNAEGFEDLNFVEEMRENLLDAWEAAEDLGVEEEIHRVRLAVEELTFALASEETRAAEENE